MCIKFSDKQLKVVSESVYFAKFSWGACMPLDPPPPPLTYDHAISEMANPHSILTIIFPYIEHCINYTTHYARTHQTNKHTKQMYTCMHTHIPNKQTCTYTHTCNNPVEYSAELL